MKNRIDIRIIVSLLLFFIGTQCKGQIWNFDNLSVEAEIGDHKRVNSLLVTRGVLESINKGLHSKSSESVGFFKSMADSLDNYTRKFEVIDFILKSGQTAFNTLAAINMINNKISDFEKLAERYNDMCLSHGDIKLADTTIIAISMDMVSSVRHDLSNIYNSYISLAETIGAGCKTALLFTILDGINSEYSRLKSDLDKYYLALWRYIMIRTTYWKSALFKKRTVKEICSDAIGRWNNARVSALLK